MKTQRLHLAVAGDGNEGVTSSANALTQPFSLMADDENDWPSKGKAEDGELGAGVGADHHHSESSQPREGLCEIGGARQMQVLDAPFGHPDRDGGQAGVGRWRPQNSCVDTEEGGAPEDGADVVRIANPLEGDGGSFGPRENPGNVLNRSPSSGLARHQKAFVGSRVDEAIHLAFAGLDA